MNLTKRELEILSLVAEEGLTNMEIADSFQIAEKTVKNHLNNIYRKLDIYSVRKAIAHYYKSIKKVS